MHMTLRYDAHHVREAGEQRLLGKLIRNVREFDS
jgi:hypothetical protein